MRLLYESSENRRDLCGFSVHGGRDHPGFAESGQVQGVEPPEGQALQILEDENRRLKKLVAEKELVTQTVKGQKL
jgi:hypothetical protein